MSAAEHQESNRPRRRTPLPHPICTTLICAVLFVTAPPSVETRGAGNAVTTRTPAEQTALGAIFNDSLRNESALEIYTQAAAMLPEQRFHFLARWVLPAADHSSLRIDIGFVPVDLPPTTALPQFHNGHAEARRLQTGGQIVAPVVKLIAAAKQLDRLPEIRRTIAAWQPSSVADEKAAAALQTLLCIAEEDFKGARTSIQKLRVLAKSDPVVFSERGPEAVVMWVAKDYPQTLELARDLALLVYAQARNQLGPRSERWHRHVYALKHEFDAAAARSPDQPQTPDSDRSLQHWKPVSRMTAKTRGRGYPLARWTLQPGQVQHLSAHDHDYLFYTIPLSGNFAVEADMSTFGYRDIQLGFGDYWAGPGYDLKACLHGNFRREFSSLKIDPPLTWPGEWMRVRLTVQDGQRQTWINGRRVYSREHPSLGNPWLVIHSPWYTNGTVKNLAVTGDVQVPRKIQLAVHPDLPGWLPYFEESAGFAAADWRLEFRRRDAGQNDTIRSDGRTAPNQKGAGGNVLGKPGATSAVAPSRAAEAIPVLRGIRQQRPETWSESLLCYHRPMFEDGVIEYDFYYRPDAFHVHPALDRLAFVLTPTAVQCHWVTDGRFDPTAADPAHMFVEPENQRVSGRLPLRHDDWNRLQLKLTDDVVNLSLNGQLIYSRRLEATNQRTFGLFHFADQSEALVRDLTWTGDWPRQLPPVSDQELVDDPSRPVIDDLAKVAVRFDHDFSNGLPSEKFTVFDGGLGTHIREQPDGVYVTRPGGEGYQKFGFGPQIRLKGDFEITAEFENLQTDVSAGGNGNCHLLVEIDDEAGSVCRLFRRDEGSDPAVTTAVFRTVDGRIRYLFPESLPEVATAGRLRLIRRGDQLHYLFAEHDSKHFRYLESQTVGTQMTAEDGIRLVQEMQGEGSSSVVWKRLTIRAEQLIHAPTTVPAVTVAQLDARAAELPVRFVHDFTRDMATDEEFLTWGETKLMPAEPNGFEVIATGSEQWTAAGLASRRQLHGDFDIALDLVAQHLEKPLEGEDSCVIFQVAFDDENRSAVEIKYKLDSSGDMTILAQKQFVDQGGRLRFRTLQTRPVTVVRGLRIARRGDSAWFLYRSGRDSPWEILAGLRTGKAVVPSTSCRLIVHTGKPGTESKVFFRHLSLSTEKPAAPADASF